MAALFSNSAMLSMSDKYDSVNEGTQEISKLIKLHILGVAKCPQNPLGCWIIVTELYCVVCRNQSQSQLEDIAV